MNLENLNSKELGKLFPIEIVPYNINWPAIFISEKNLLKKALGKTIALRIEHFGSTAITGLSAKPAIDILIEIPPLNDKLKENIIQRMKILGYQFIWRTDEIIPYMNFVKGYTSTGFRGNIFHVHMGDKTHPVWNRIYFRDYLRQNPLVAKEYELLKLKLANKYKFDREKYTNSKGAFVRRITNLAIENSALEFNEILKGGDLRSIGKSNEVVAIINSQKKFNELFLGLKSPDRKIVMRTADTIEKITLKNVAFLQNHKNDLITLLQNAENIELKWHLALLVSRLNLTAKEFGTIWERLAIWAKDKKESKIVRVNSIQGLFNLLKNKPDMLQAFYLTLTQIEKENIPSLNARIRKIKKCQPPTVL